MKTQFPELSDRVSFIQADIEELKTKVTFQPDVIIIYYTLCAINSQNGKFIQFFQEIKSIASSRCQIIIEEEYPIDYVKGNGNKAQHLWANQSIE